MSYENGVELHTAGLAGIAAFTVASPRAFPLLLLAGASLSNPGSMDKAANDWRGVAADFDGLAAELTALTGSVPEGKWAAEDRQRFEDSVAAFKEELKKAGHMHKGMGDGMGAMAGLYYSFALLVLMVGSLLTALTFAILAARLTGVGAGVAQIAADRIADGLKRILQAAQKKKLLAIGIVSALMYAVHMWNQSQQNELRRKGMNPSHGGPPAFTQAELHLTTGDPGHPNLDLPGISPKEMGIPGTPAPRRPGA